MILFSHFSVKPQVKKTLQIVTDLVETIALSGVSMSKKICFQSLQAHSVLQTTMVLMPVYIGQADVADGILQFFLALFQGMNSDHM